MQIRNSVIEGLSRAADKGGFFNVYTNGVQGFFVTKVAKGDLNFEIAIRDYQIKRTYGFRSETPAKGATRGVPSGL
jgi:hypothetical protein